MRDEQPNKPEEPCLNTDVPQVRSKTDSPRSPASRATPPQGLLIPAAMRDRALRALAEGLMATKTQWDAKEKGLRTDPDHATRVKAAELILAYAEGRPVERVVKLTGDVSTYDDRLEKLLATPEGLRIARTLGIIQKTG
jgi:hypothetical protein